MTLSLQLAGPEAAGGPCERLEGKWDVKGTRCMHNTGHWHWLQPDETTIYQIQPEVII